MAQQDTTFNLGSSEEAAGVGVGAASSKDSMVFNLNDVEEKASSFEVLPKGTYNAVVEQCDYGESAAGNPMLSLVYSITDGEFAERKIFDYIVLSGKGAEFALPKLKQLLTRVCPEVDISHFNPSQFAEDAILVNRLCQLKLGITTQKKGDYKGEKRNQVREVLAADSTGNGSFLG
jgi:hypothetical protein